MQLSCIQVWAGELARGLMEPLRLLAAALAFLTQTLPIRVSTHVCVNGEVG